MMTESVDVGNDIPANDNQSEQQASEKEEGNFCNKCSNANDELSKLAAEKLDLQRQMDTLKSALETTKNQLEREVQRRCDLEQRFTEEAKRSTDQIEELIAKSDQDDAKLNELRKKFELYSRETASMIESFTTNREVQTSQLIELREENDSLLEKFVSHSKDLLSP